MKKREFLALLGAGGLMAVGGVVATNYRYDGLRLWNDCPLSPLPEEMRNGDFMQKIFSGLDFNRVRDAHVHLIGSGDSGGGVWFNPAMRQWTNVTKYLAMRLYMNTACVSLDDADRPYVRRLRQMADDFPPGFKLMLLAFDWFHDENGVRVAELSPYYAPNAYAQSVAAAHPDRFEWIASVHPYRRDALEALEWAKENGAKAVKWLPQAMGMDPDSARCDPYYETMARLNLTLLCHTGDETAAPGGGGNELGNPLRLLRPLQHGVRVIAAHCASHGKAADADGTLVDASELFFRMLDNPEYQNLLFGDISAVTLANRPRRFFEKIIANKEWHHRLLFGSDFPLPGIIPIIRLGRFVDWGMLTATDAEMLTQLRRHNAILFDFALKRCLRMEGKSFADAVFENAEVFSATSVAGGK